MVWSESLALILSESTLEPTEKSLLSDATADPCFECPWTISRMTVSCFVCSIFNLHSSDWMIPGASMAYTKALSLSFWSRTPKQEGCPPFCDERCLWLLLPEKNKLSCMESSNTDANGWNRRNGMALDLFGDGTCNFKREMSLFGFDFVMFDIRNLVWHALVFEWEQK